MFSNVCVYSDKDADAITDVHVLGIVFHIPMSEYYVDSKFA